MNIILPPPNTFLYPPKKKVCPPLDRIAVGVLF